MKLTGDSSLRKFWSRDYFFQKLFRDEATVVGTVTDPFFERRRCKIMRSRSSELGDQTSDDSELKKKFFELVGPSGGYEMVEWDFEREVKKSFPTREPPYRGFNKWTGGG